MTPIKDKLDKVILLIGTLSERLRYDTEMQERVLASEKRKMTKFDELLTRTDWNVPQTMNRLDKIERAQRKIASDNELINRKLGRMEEKLESVFKLVTENQTKGLK